MTYHAFISYSHEERALQARRLHQALLRFASPWYRRRGLRLFLDDANLPASPSLWESIRKGLEDSEHLILLASPSAAASPWCQKEIRFWLEERGPERIVLVLLSGGIHWDAASNDFDWSKSTALPRELAGVFADEPFYVDVSSLSADDRYRGAAAKSRLADIAAVLLDKPKDDLIGKDLRQHQNALRLAGAAIAILLSTSILAGWQWYQATVQRDLAEARSLPLVATDKPSVREWTVDQKARVLADAINLTGEELTAYLEREGVKLAEFEQWRLALEEGGRASTVTTKRIRELERELARKEKALAEAAALLVLKERWRASTTTRTKTPTGRARTDPLGDCQGAIVGCPVGGSMPSRWYISAYRSALAKAAGWRRPPLRPSSPTAQCSLSHRGSTDRECTDEFSIRGSATEATCATTCR